jgi:hypothetical protein
LRSPVKTQFLLVVLFALTGHFTFAQTQIGSPYSRFGIGDLARNSSIVNMGMGGVSLAFSSPLYINTGNPASYARFDSTSFVFEGSAYGRLSTLHTDQLSQKSQYASLGSLLFGFPVTKWWKSSLGLLPVSNLGYKIFDTQINNTIGKAQYTYTGSGGLSQFYIGSAFKLHKNLSFGVNASFVFGPLNKEQSVSFPDSVFIFGTKTTNTIHVQDILFSYGLLYHKTFNTDRFFAAGLTFSNSQKANGTEDFLATNFTHDYVNNIDIHTDTVLYKSGITNSIMFPSSFGVGVSVGRTDRWLTAADFKMQDWSKFKYDDHQDSLKNSFEISAGTQFKPSFNDAGSYLSRIQYRFGVRYAQTYLQLHNTRLNEQAISFGFGLPMKKSRSTFNLAVEAGKRGTTSNNLIRENFVRISFGVSFYERWFLQQKYD